MENIEELKKELEKIKNECFPAKVGYLRGVLTVKEKFGEILTHKQILELMEILFD